LLRRKTLELRWKPAWPFTILPKVVKP
jgi:hypothetical protein